MKSAIHNTGMWASEQGQRDKSWWPEKRKCSIVRVQKTKVLIEYQDGSRVWANNCDLENVE